MNPFVGGALQTANLKIDISTLTASEVDGDGNLIPGVLFQADGTRAGSAANQKAYGASIAPIKVAASNVNLAANTNDLMIAVGTHGLINQDIVNSNLGRPYSANELAAFDGGLKVTPT